MGGEEAGREYGIYLIKSSSIFSSVLLPDFSNHLQFLMELTILSFSASISCAKFKKLPYWALQCIVIE